MTTTTSASAPSGAPRESTTDVLVVGAGPVGLALACALRHHGVHCRVVEQRTELRGTSRANNLWSRPQELLAAVGARDAIARTASPVAAVNVLLDGRPLDQVALTGLPTPYGAALSTSQAVIERVLTRTLEERGGLVEGGRKLLSLEQDADGVDVEVSSGEDEGDGAEQIRCRYVVGADGGHSTVRDQLGIVLNTHTMPERTTRQIDARLSWRRTTDPDQVCFTYRRGFAGVLPVSGGYHRLFFLEEEALVPDRDPTLAEMQERAREVTGDETVALSDPVWFSHGGFEHGVAEAHGRGRVLLAGDAGHRNLPIGGQGMSAGIHDAVGAAWRLAMSLAGEAGPAVLESYAAERNREHSRLDADQAKGFKRLMYRNRVEDAALGAAADLIPNVGSRIFGADDLQQLSETYRDSALSDDSLPGLPLTRRGAPQAGDRAPDAAISAPGGRSGSLFEHVYNPDGHTWGWCLLAFDGRDRTSRADLARAVTAVAGRPWVHPRLVLADPLPIEEEGGPIRLFDLDGHAHAAYDLEGRAAVVLIRPDGHIACRVPADGADTLRRSCERISAADGDAAAPVEDRA